MSVLSATNVDSRVIGVGLVGSNPLKEKKYDSIQEMCHTLQDFGKGCCVCPICLKTICVLKMNVEANGVCAQCAAKKDTKGPYFGHPTLSVLYQGKI